MSDDTKQPAAEYTTGEEDDCVGCGLPTTRWVEAMCCYPLCPLCMTEAQAEHAAGEPKT